MMEFFVRTVKASSLQLFSQKSSLIDICHGSKYSSELLFWCYNTDDNAALPRLEFK